MEILADNTIISVEITAGLIKLWIGVYRRTTSMEKYRQIFERESSFLDDDCHI